MALRLGKTRDVEKASYYVWFLGALEARGLRGREFVSPVVRELMRKEQHVDPSKVTLQVSDKGLKIVQHVPKKGGKGRTEPVKHFIPDHAITCAVQEPSPDHDIVSCILLIFNPVTKCPVHVHTYRCDSADTAALLAGQLQTLAARPDNRTHIEEIEARLVERGLLAAPVPAPPQQQQQQQQRHDAGHQPRDGRQQHEKPPPPPPEPAPSSGGGSAGSAGSPAVATLYDSLAAELRTRIHDREAGPLLLPPRDYDTSAAAGKAPVQEDSSGIGSDDAPSPDHRDRDRTSSDEEWEAAGHSTEDLLLESSSPWRQRPGWRGGRRSAGGQSPDTDELLTSGHSSSRKPASQRQRSPSTSPQDRFNHARLKFVQMEQEKETAPPPIVSPKKTSSSDTRSPDVDHGRGWPQPSRPEGAVPSRQEPATDKGWRLPQPTKQDASGQPAPHRASDADTDWPQTRPSHDGGGQDDVGRRQAERAAPADGSAEALRRDARGRPHVADIFRQTAPEPARPDERVRQRRDDDDVAAASDVKQGERVRSTVRVGRQPAALRCDSAALAADGDPRPDEVSERVHRWVRSSAEATPFTRALSCEEAPLRREAAAAAAAEAAEADSWRRPEPEPPAAGRRLGRHPSEPAERRAGEPAARLAKSRSTDAFLDAHHEPAAVAAARGRPAREAGGEIGEQQWRRGSAQVAAELRQLVRAAAPDDEQPDSPAARHRAAASAQSEPRPAERRGRGYQELQGASRLPGLDRDTARDHLCPPAEVPPHRPTLELDYRQHLPRRRDRSCDARERSRDVAERSGDVRERGGDIREQRRPSAREQRRDDADYRHRADDHRPRADDHRARARYPEEHRPRGGDAPPAGGQAFSDHRKSYPKPSFEVRGRSRHSLADPRATQYDYRASVTAYPY